MARIHFVGVGKMGLPMAMHLHRAGHSLSVSDTSAQQQALAAERGLSVMDAQLALPGVDMVFSSLPGDAALLSVAAQVAAFARAGTLWVDTSTVSPAASAEAAACCERAGLQCLRTTVSGNNHMAEAAQLTVMASGPRAAYDTALPLLNGRPFWRTPRKSRRRICATSSSRTQSEAASWP
jgi:3-hydroxyisobutyrate dehydrogenase